MSTAEFIAELAGRGVTLEAAPGGKLRYSPKSKLDADDLALLKARKDSILNILSYTPSPLSPLSPVPQNTDGYGKYGGDSDGDSSQTPAVTTVTGAVTPPEFVRRRYEQAAATGLIAKWSPEFGYVSLHDPTTGEWHDLPTKEAPGWAKWEASKRKELYKGGNRNAYRLTAREMEKLWVGDHPDDPFGEDGATDERGLVYEDYLKGDGDI